MNKQVLRELYLEKRLLLTKREMETRNQVLVNLFFKHISLNNLKNIHVYLPIEKKKEPNTRLLIERIRKEQPDIHIILSKSHNNGNLKHYKFETENQLKQNKWGIQEPEYGEEIEPSAIDLVIVPMVVHDRKGHRIGYGKGYYDRFLNKVSDKTLKVGYTLTPPLDDLKYYENFDIKLDCSISPAGFLKFS